MSKSKLITYYAGFSSHLKFDDKDNLEKEVSTLKPLNNLILDGVEKSDEDFEIRNAYLGWCSLFLHIINNQQCELYNICYTSIRKNQIVKTNCKLSNDPFDLKSLECNNNETYLVCNDRKVKCWPKNDFSNELMEVKDLMDDSDRKSRVRQISVGNSFVCALLESGIVKMLDEKGITTDFVLEDDEFEYVSCGLEFLLLLSKKGLVYDFGSNQKGQLGIGSELSDVTEDCKLIEALEGLKVTQISAGGWHSLVLESGNIYSFGLNQNGQLGIDQSTSGIVDLPTLVSLPSELEFIMVKAGSRHSMAVTSEGLCYVWGFNKYGQTGLNAIDFNEIRIPKQLELKGKVVSIECKFWSSLVQVYYP